jgi:hypothetical protein
MATWIGVRNTSAEIRAASFSAVQAIVDGSVRDDEDVAASASEPRARADGIYQLFGRGDPCTVDGVTLRRRASVTFICSRTLPRSKTSFRVAEPQQCVYVFIVHTQLVCGLY